MLVEFERVVTGADPYDIGDLEDGFESDALLSDISCRLVESFFRTAPDFTDGLCIRLGETELITINTYNPIRERDAEGRRRSRVGIIISILNEL